jgi:hypothetical protein
LAEHGIDMIILAECRIESAAMLQALSLRAAVFHFPFSNMKGIAIFTRFNPEFLRPAFESARFSSGA